ncbi:cellulase family glycosylhydrolase [Chryseolinea lacunae]|uniref:Cellulase family glycosylhydrolase n=1 Tax=Chryseolinea lacunae TaxID=2801331 RepID=A0ABS1KKD6_9BACT|nr:cellulase family glycosylhydrolase [Chryseolinea lacunae]MBL0739908.1 cellulase family glycosylhydrolase [Chryseolinea lacunae]
MKATLKKSGADAKTREGRVAVRLLSSLMAVMFFAYACKDDEPVTTTPEGGATFTVSGKSLLDPCGAAVVLKGVNKMSVFDEEDPNGTAYFPEIAKSGANAVRIVWRRTYSSGAATDPAQLELLIQNCMNEKMIPIVEMHDATCDLGGLDAVVNYWVSTPILALVKKYEHALLVNVANEAGDNTVTANQFVTAYKGAITKLRNAGINAPLIIDAPECGKNLELVVPVASQLIQHDPLHNIMISAHPYWSKVADATPAFIADQLKAANDANVPLLLGEVAANGGWPGQGVDETKSCSTEGEVNYVALLTEAAKYNMGWLLWEWGPGNGYYERDPVVLCPAMDITSNGTYASITAIQAGAPNAWAKDAVITGSYSIKNTAVKTPYVQNGFTCP